MITGKETFTVNEKDINTVPGNCSTYNIIYLFKCKICNKPYTGRSTRPLNTRTGEHRRAFLDIIQGNDYNPLDNDYSLGTFFIFYFSFYLWFYLRLTYVSMHDFNRHNCIAEITYKTLHTDIEHKDGSR